MGEDDDLQEMIEELSGFSTVFMETGKSQIAIVGKDMFSAGNVLSRISGVLAGHKIYLMSMGGTGGSLSIVVDRNELDGIIKDLHKVLFTDESSD